MRSRRRTSAISNLQPRPRRNLHFCTPAAARSMDIAARRSHQPVRAEESRHRSGTRKIREASPTHCGMPTAPTIRCSAQGPTSVLGFMVLPRPDIIPITSTIRAGSARRITRRFRRKCRTATADKARSNSASPNSAWASATGQAGSSNPRWESWCCFPPISGTEPSRSNRATCALPLPSTLFRESALLEPPSTQTSDIKG